MWTILNDFSRYALLMQGLEALKTLHIVYIRGLGFNKYKLYAKKTKLSGS